MRYHLLRAEGTIRRVSVCLVLVVVSYMVAALVNASPVRQPALVSPYSRGRVIVVSPPQSGSDAFPIEVPAAGPEPALAPATTIQTL